MQIKEDFRDLIPALSTEELELLEISVLSEGIRDKLILWQDILLDGHNRYNLAIKHNLTYETMSLDFNDENDAKAWIINNQFGRRNLNAFTRAELALKLKPLLAEKAKENQKKGVCLNSDEGNTGDKLAKTANLGRDTIFKVEKILQKADEETIQKLKSGEKSINEAYKKINPHIAEASGCNEWFTPPTFIHAARKTLGTIDLDPASCEEANKNVKATKFYSEKDDGLQYDWKGKVWMNPPYESGLIEKFIDKVVNCTEAIVLVNNATETKWFQKLANASKIICFPNSRIKFIAGRENNSKSAPLQGQAIAYIGPNSDAFIHNFQDYGFCVEVK